VGLWASFAPSRGRKRPMGLFSIFSAVGFYSILLLFAFPATRPQVGRLFGHSAKPTSKYLPGFDSIRGAAALLVVLGHCIYFAYPAFIGLPSTFVLIANQASKAVLIFCTLSGFLIYRAVAGISELKDLRSYCVRRFFRVYPVYAIGVIVALFLNQYAGPDMSPATSESARFFADLFVLRVLWWPGFANPVSWSLYHEILFYALLPLIVLTVGQRRMAAFAAVAILGMLLADYPSRDYGLYKYFLFGILASCYSERLKPYATAVFLIGAILVIAEFASIDLIFRLGLTPAKGLTGGSFGLGLGMALVLATLPHLSSVGKTLDVFPLKMLGMVSYSLYVIHPFVLRLTFPQMGNLVTARDYSQFPALATIGPAGFAFVVIPSILFWSAVCFVAVERPGLQFGNYLVARRRRQSITINAAISPAA
jgi:peptidoglycan/LPS O-acetylase OafA/YrhL